MKLKARKIPYYLLLSPLTIGASLIIGFLSFGGMLALYPVLLPAIATFVLSTAYEGEIYLQNLNGALNKLFFKHNYLQRQFANDYLLQQFPKELNGNFFKGTPQFFKDYEAQLRLLQPFYHRHLSKAEYKQKKKLEKTLSDMEKWFARQLFSKSEGNTVYERELQAWLLENQGDLWKAKLRKRRIIFHGVKVFSLTAGIFMGLGTTYLLSEAFAAIPVLCTISATTLPFIIAPLALIAGAAYGLLTYNAVTDMISNDTLRKWSKRIWQETKNVWTHKSVRSALIVLLAVALFALAIALTICTAGTWWTVTKNTRPLFAWMGKMPNFVMGIINPVITSFSSLVFNTENTCETLEFITNKDSQTGSTESTQQKENIFKWLLKKCVKLGDREHIAQIINPFRFILKVTFMPLRALLFAGHLISIGVTADRMPGLSEVWSALLGILSEGFEDLHYFFGHEHEHEHVSTQDILAERLAAGHGHDHSADLPTRLLRLTFAPLFFLAAGWDYVASQLFNTADEQNQRKKLSFGEAWCKQTGKRQESREDVIRPRENAVQPSQEWRAVHACYHIKKQEKKLENVIVGRKIAKEKVKALNAAQKNLAENPCKLDSILESEKNNTVYAQRRFFSPGKKTGTQEFLAKLPSRINTACGA